MSARHAKMSKRGSSQLHESFNDSPRNTNTQYNNNETGKAEANVSSIHLNTNEVDKGQREE